MLSSTFYIYIYMKKERKIKNENGAKKQQKTTFLMQMIYCDRRVKVVFLLDVNDYKTKIREYYKYRS